MELIVAVDRNWAIGKDGDQLVYIPEDLKRFKTLTMGHPVILGRKTLATFPGGRPLKGRDNLILSRDPDFAPEGAQVFHDANSLLAHAPEDSCVIGGASVYNLLVDECDTAHVTKIDWEFPADTWFPNLDEREGWELVGEEGPYPFEHLTYSYLTYKKVK